MMHQIERHLVRFVLCFVCLYLFFFSLPSFTLFATGPLGPLIADRAPNLYDRNQRDRDREERGQQRRDRQSQVSHNGDREHDMYHIMLYPPY